MNYYKRHLGDYAKDTKHLSLLEHGAYTLLLDYYYATEKPIPDGRCERVAGASTEAERSAVQSVLREFFVLSDEGWSHGRAESVIADAIGKTSKAVDSATTRWGTTNDAAATRAQRLSRAREKGTHTKLEWELLVNVCGNACVRCGAEGVVKDHITPIYQGGSDGIENLQPLCRKCNSSKGPENKDLRPEGWKEHLQECLRNACETPASHKPLATSQLKAEEPKGSLPPDGGNEVPCPHQEILALYHELLPANPRIKVWDSGRATALRTRWREDEKRQSLDYWRRFFTHVAASDFLTGKREGSGGRPFLPGLEWMVKAANFAKIIEGRYHS